MGEEETIAKAGIDALMKPITDFLEKIAGPAAEELGLTLKDHIKVFRFKRQLRLFERVKAMLEEADLEPQRVPYRLLAPIVEIASLEERDDLQDKWAALLANASGGQSDVHPCFIRLLEQISPLEAMFLDRLRSSEPASVADCVYAIASRETRPKMTPLLDEETASLLGKLLYDLGLNTLGRLGLVCREDEATHDFVGIDRPQAGSRYRLTSLGAVLVDACKAPRKRSHASGVERIQ